MVDLSVRRVAVAWDLFMTPVRPEEALRVCTEFLERLEARYGGTWLGRQELQGELIREREGALWNREMIEATRIDEAGTLSRVVVAGPA